MQLSTDTAFDALYPPAIRRHAFTHFTPVAVARAAARFLATKAGTRVLDVGSGAGKFCCVGALATEGKFIGVERRPALHSAAVNFAKQQQIERAEFVLADIKEIRFSTYDAFFLFNPFYENKGVDEPIDDSVALESKQYDFYCAYVREQLADCPRGTRLATYYSFFDDVPEAAYRLVEENTLAKLCFWERL